MLRQFLDTVQLVVIGYNQASWNKIAEQKSTMAMTGMRAFVRVVERGGFSAASKDLGMTPSAVAKLVTRLEDRLGVRLLHRTTRRVALTPEGETYHLRARDILAAIEDADAEVSQAGQRPRGKLRVNCVPAFAFHQLMPVLPVFVSRCPDVELEFAITDRLVDLLAVNADVGIRTGEGQDSSLVARKIGATTRGLFASPTYLKRHGTPPTPADLCDHQCIAIQLSTAFHRWPFREGKVVEVKGCVQVDSTEAALRLAIAGGGIVRLADLSACEAVRDGLLRPVLVKSYLGETIPLSAVYPQGRHRMPKVRMFLDFLVEHFGHSPWRLAS